MCTFNFKDWNLLVRQPSTNVSKALLLNEVAIKRQVHLIQNFQVDFVIASLNIFVKCKATTNKHR